MTKSVTSDLKIALEGYQAFVARLAPRADIGPVATDEDLVLLAIHLEDALKPGLMYAEAVIRAASDATPGGVDDETGFLADAIAEVVGALRRASNRRLFERRDAAAAKGGAVVAGYRRSRPVAKKGEAA